LSVDPLDSVFGRIVPSHVLDQAVTDTIKTWADTYLRVVAEQWNRDKLPAFRSYNVRPSGERWAEDQLPALIVVNAGLDAAPVRGGDGQYDAPFRVGTVIICSSKTAPEALANLGDYTAAVRAILLQHGSLGGVASGIEWVSETYNEADADAGRTQAGGVVEFVITMSYVVNRRRRPAAPDAQPTDVLSTVEETFLTVDDNL
jgi:hypothetical protein